MNQVPAFKLIEIIEEYRKAHVEHVFPSEFSLYSYAAKVRPYRDTQKKIWEVYLEDQWRLPNDTFRVSFVREKVINSLHTGDKLVPTLELLLRRVKASLFLKDTLCKETSLELPIFC